MSQNDTSEREATDEEIDTENWAEDALFTFPPLKGSEWSPSPKLALDAEGKPVTRPGGSPRDRVKGPSPRPINDKALTASDVNLPTGPTQEEIRQIRTLFDLLEAASQRIGGEPVESIWNQCHTDAEAGNPKAIAAVEKITALMGTLLSPKNQIQPDQKQKDDAMEALEVWYKATSHYLNNRRKSYGRTCTKLQVKPAKQLRLPMTEYAKDVFMGLAKGEFIATEGRDAVFTAIGKAQLRIECDDAGFDTIRAVEVLAHYGPATMQTFLGLMGLWIDNNPGASHETYFTARVTDLMRFMHRKEKGGGGSYNTEDQMQKGREVYILSRATVPKATVKRVNAKNGIRITETISIDRLLNIQTITAQRTLEEGKEIQSLLEFRYHPNREMHDMLCGGTPQFAQVSGKLLGYHPVKQKYQIILGFGLAFYDRANRKHRRQSHTISLPALMKITGIEPPVRNTDRFLSQIQQALSSLDEDGLIPGVQMKLSMDCKKPSRKKMEEASITFPALRVAEPNHLLE